MGSKSKLEKPKIQYTKNNCSDIIDKYIKKNDKDILDRQIILEKWLDDNKDICLAYGNVSDYFNKFFSKDDVNYLMRAFRLPFHEINNIARQYFALNNDMMDILLFKIMEKYDVDRGMAARRIEEVLIINYLINEENKVKDNSNSKKKKIR